jgi:hypothetical protein
VPWSETTFSLIYLLILPTVTDYVYSKDGLVPFVDAGSWDRCNSAVTLYSLVSLYYTYIREDFYKEPFFNPSDRLDIFRRNLIHYKICCNQSIKQSINQHTTKHVLYYGSSTCFGGSCQLNSK